MKATGMVRRVDDLGRIVIPKDYRERLAFEGKVEIVLTSSGVLIRNPEYKLVKKDRTATEDN